MKKLSKVAGDYASLKRKCVDCKKPLSRGAHYVEGKGPFCTGHALQRQVGLELKKNEK